MWTGQQLDPDSPIYNMAFCIEIPARIDSSAFQAAFSQIVSGSESLRTTIELIQGVPHLKVNEKIAFDFPVLDFSQAVDPESSAKAWCQQRCRQIFDLTACLFDTALLQLGDSSYCWYINHHHLITDAWAITQLLRRQSENYSRIKNGLPSSPLEMDVEFISQETHTDNDPLRTSEFVPIVFYGNQPARIRSNSNRVSVVANEEPIAKATKQSFFISGSKIILERTESIQRAVDSVVRLFASS